MKYFIAAIVLLFSCAAVSGEAKTETGYTQAEGWQTFTRRTVEQDVALYNELEKKKGIEINGRLYRGGDEIYMDAMGTVRIDGVPVQDPVGSIMPVNR